MSKAVVRLTGISKKYGNTIILDDISLSLYPGRILCLIGENGAGKTTLMKIMMGITKPDSGNIEIRDNLVIHNHPWEAHKNGFRMVYQEPELVNHLSVIDNIFLNYEQRKFGIILDRKQMISKAETILKKLNCNFNSSDKVNELSFPDKRKVCIARAVLQNPEVLIIDEPTNSMVQDDVLALFDYLREIKRQNISIIYISHKLSESMLIADDIVVLRDGRLIRHESQDNYNSTSLLTDISGNDLLNRYPKASHKLDRIVYYAKNITSHNLSVRDCSISLTKGEILGITGLQGAKKNVLGKALFGLIPLSSGKIIVHGKKQTALSPLDSIKRGVAYISENLTDNLDFNRSISENITITDLDCCTKGPFVSPEKTGKVAFELLLKLNMRLSIERPLDKLSGGELQKVVLAKWLNTNCDIFIFSEPTQNLDIASRVEFYNILNKITEAGKSVILISSDFEEILGMSDRIFIMQEGQIIKKMANSNLTSKDLMRIASMYTE